VPPLSRDASVLYFPPEAFGPFRVLHQIGAGILGPVFRAFEPDRDRLVAVKVFRIDLAPDRQESLVRALAFLVEIGPIHPAIATPIRAGVEAGVVYLAQEYAVGESLDAALGGRRVANGAEALSLLDPLADAIDAADLHGLNHGLLHPRDIVLAQDGPVVTGFGVARALAEAGIPLPVRRGYAAPEIVAGGEWDTRADVFALGVIARELMFGRGRAAGEQPEPALAEALDRATAAAPDSRFTKGRGFVDAVRAALELDELAIPGDAEEVQAAAVVDVGPDATDVGRAEAADVGPAAPAVGPNFSSAGEVDEPAPFEFEFGFLSETDDNGEARGLQEPAAPADSSPLTAADEAPVSTEVPAQGASAVGVPEAQSVELDWMERPVERSGPPAEPERQYSPYQKPVVPEVLRAQRRTRGRKRVLLAVAGVAMAAIVAFAVRGIWPRPSPSAVSAPVPAAPTDLTPAPKDPVAGVPPSSEPAARPPAAAGAEKPATVAGSVTARRAAAAAGAEKPGRLQVRSSPTRARVLVNGAGRGVTPLTLRELPLGSYTIRVERDGYAPAERRVRLTAGRPSASLTVPLTRQPAPPPGGAPGRGSLVVETRPAGARVFVDGRLAGTAPMAIPDLPAGPVSVRIEREGYRTWTSTVQIAAGERSRVGASLVRSEEQ
jgi:hypothetical protein